MKKRRFPGFAKCLHMMRSRNAVVSEDGFGWLLPRPSEFLPELMAEFGRERDHGLRCWLLELIGEARDSRALALLVEQLRSPDESFRWWAVRGLRALNTHEARKALFDAGASP
jgi:hypothetical protein